MSNFSSIIGRRKKGNGYRPNRWIRRFKGKERKLYKQISSEIEREIQNHPNYADLHNQLGLLLMVEDSEGAESVLYEDQKEWKEARREYRRILEITPDDENVRRRLENIS
jgi:tetratricopeptide (TPR) repeat protein